MCDSCMIETGTYVSFFFCTDEIKMNDILQHTAWTAIGEIT